MENVCDEPVAPWFRSKTELDLQIGLYLFCSPTPRKPPCLLLCLSVAQNTQRRSSSGNWKGLNRPGCPEHFYPDSGFSSIISANTGMQFKHHQILTEPGGNTRTAAFLTGKHVCKLTAFLPEMMGEGGPYLKYRWDEQTLVFDGPGSGLAA